MELIAIDTCSLDEYGLISPPWIIRDPENLRYIKDQIDPFLIKTGKTICGFMAKRKSSAQNIIDYLVFEENISTKTLKDFNRLFLADKPTQLTTYIRNPETNIWGSLNFQIRLGQIFLEKSLDTVTKNSLTSFSPPAIKIEELGWSKDQQKICDIYRTCFPKSEWNYIEQFQWDPFSKTANIFVAKIENKIVGLWIHVIYFEDCCFLCWIGVAPQFRRQKIASQMLEYGSHLARNGQCRKMCLLVQPENTTAIRFYQNHGFNKIWQRIHLSKK